MTVLVTGAAGFIGMHVCQQLLADGEAVIGLDSLNSYYDPALKTGRLQTLDGKDGFTFKQVDIADYEGVQAAIGDRSGEITGVVHLAAQAGVRYSLQKPFEYARSNLEGHLAILELCRHHLPELKHLVYASSSSVYGANTDIPFSIEDRVDRPVSLYAATKRADELISHAYSHLYRIPQTGLRFFTVYGPWGRPDMAYYSFTDAIVSGRPITLFNHGKMRRDFTYIDDIVSGVLAALANPPSDTGAPPQRVFNLGNNEPVELERFVKAIEGALGQTAEILYDEMQPGDVVETYADIDASTELLGYQPTTSIEDGIAKFIDWYKKYHRINS